MKIPQTILFLLAFITTIHALALPASFESISDSAKELFKRKGGGGGGGRGGGGGSSSSSSSSSSSGSRGSGSSSSSSGSSSSGRTSSTSNTGGSTSKGSGPLPAYGSGRSYYAGGASVPYSSGARRTGLGAPILLGAGAGALAYGAYAYPYGAFYYPYYHPWYYHNNTANRNETKPVACVCDQYSSCGCDDNNSTDYVNAVANNNTVSRVANINGTDTLVVNGTLPNGTTAPGGSDSAAAGLKMGMLQQAGYWPLIAGVAYTIWLM